MRGIPIRKLPSSCGRLGPEFFGRRGRPERDAVTSDLHCSARCRLVAPKVDEGENRYYACILLIAAGAAGAFASLDLFFFYAFHELALIPTFLMIGIWGSGNRQGAAWKITIYLSIGSIILLVGLIGLYLLPAPEQRTFNIVKLQQLASSGAFSGPGSRSVYFLLLLGFGILVSLFPFHTWAPQAYASAPVPVTMLHAGVLKKFGLYGLLQSGSAADAGSSAALGLAALDPAGRQHPVRRTGHDFPKAARSHPRLFERHAHGICIPWNREL